MSWWLKDRIQRWVHRDCNCEDVSILFPPGVTRLPGPLRIGGRGANLIGQDTTISIPEGGSAIWFDKGITGGSVSNMTIVQQPDAIQKRKKSKRKRKNKQKSKKVERSPWL